MKKAVSIIMAVIMLTSVLSLFAVSASATSGEPTAPETGKEFVMYVADSGDDSKNDGLTADKPKKTINKAIDYMANYVSPTNEYTKGKIVLVGDVTITGSTDASGYANFPLTITSADKANARLLLAHNFRISGETLFTNIQVLMTASSEVRHLIADGDKLTMGLPNVPNDVITYDPNVSTRPLCISGGFVSWSQSSKVIDVTLNSGTYQTINTGSYSYAGVVDTDVNFVINEGVTVTDGVISLGGGMQNKTTKLTDTGIKVGGDYNVTINGGTFTNTNIHIGVLASGSGGYRHCSVAGDTTIDINGGTFTDCTIDTYETLGGVASKDISEGNGVDFAKGITVDFTDIPNDKKATYTAMVGTANTAQTLTKNKITVVEHSKTELADVDDSQHKIYCPCGCGLEELVAHKYDEGKVTMQPSHSTPGEKTYTCSECGGTKLEKIDPDSTTHNYTTGWVSADDTNHKKTCDDSACPDPAKGEVVEPHKLGEGKVTKEATHTEEGTMEYSCSECDYKKVEPIAKLTDHTFGNEFVYHDEENHKRLCECGDAKMSAHYWDGGKVTKEATADEEGEKTYTCSDCGGKKTEVIAKLAADTEEEKSGCGSSVGAGIALVLAVSLAGIAFVPKKKKN